MKKILSLITPIIIIFLLTSGILTDFMNFFSWLLMLEYNSPNISFEGGIIVRILTFMVSYGLVGIIFNKLGYFNGKIMSLAYFIISSILGFIFSYIVWKIEEYYIYIFIFLGLILLIIVIYILVIIYKNNKKEEN